MLKRFPWRSSKVKKMVSNLESKNESLKKASAKDAVKLELAVRLEKERNDARLMIKSYE